MCVMKRQEKSGKGAGPSRSTSTPLIIKSGNTTVRIYRGASIKDGVSYPLHTLAFYEDGKRIRRTFADIAEAKREAEKVANRLDNGDRDAARMNSTDAQAMAIAQRELAPFSLPILEAVRAYVAAVKLLPPGTPLHTAAQFYASRHAAQRKRALLPDVVREFIEAKRQDGLSPLYIKTLRSILAPNEEGSTSKPRNSFGDAFRTYIDSITTSDMDAWLRSRGGGPRRRRNITLYIRTLFNFARDMGYLPKNQPTEADGLTLPKKKVGEIGIFTPDEMRRLFAGTAAHPVNDEYRLWLAIGAFSGLRTAEMLRIKWGEHVQVARGQIVISADIAKTGGWRIIRMPDNLKAWLAPYASMEGPVFTSRADDRAHRYAIRLGVGWKNNALRHSWISYAVKLTENIAAVSLEAGNSPQIIKTNYFELVEAPEAAQEWFSILPTQMQQTQLPMTVAA